MSEILESVFAATVSPSVVSEQHDTSAIYVDTSNVDSEMRSRSGAWDAREFGLTAAQVTERLANANTPEARAAVEADLRRRAIGRANLDTSTGRVAFAGSRQSWHRLGVTMSGPMPSALALREAGLDWIVEKIELRYSFAGNSRPTDQFALVRADTGAYLGSVGGRYKPIQNAQALEFLDAVLDQHGAHIETAGAVDGGRQIFASCLLPRQCWKVRGSDPVETYAVITNPHDGSGVARCIPTTVRVECQNTLRAGLRDGADAGLRIRHTGRISQKIADAQEALGLAVSAFDELRQQSETLAAKNLSITHYANDVLDAVLDVTAADALKGANALAAAIATTEAERELAAKSFARKLARRSEVLDDILERYESEKCGKNGIRGTAWAALNAVTEHADHADIGRKVGTTEARNSRRFVSVLAGDADRMKQAALSIALQA